ncbi:putative transmembrane transcriptional regulator (anti-sigma factor) [Anaerohalosphaera lusitana]|uniref:Putative transmembrane transcriptional regulator (Anti-sigma factor) n=1 Tax=Anaerohalosphaera lusitana TaxID=1936003 RepID=A0A1U9NNX7_9BACT|nr:carboxypeptidase regulatory-like domain-containing protein [Anaerohalosphaera lusitana]AQT69652.1 putative transmembrane transcriptional regulator (anti-sigma factor) [Anaerohalosphaera lusitana]
MMKRCEHIRDMIAEMVGGFAGADQVGEVREHIEICSDCREYERALREEDELLREFAASTQADMGQRMARVMDEVRSQEAVGNSNGFSVRYVLRRAAVWSAAAVIVVGVLIGFAVMKDEGGSDEPIAVEQGQDEILERDVQNEIAVAEPVEEVRDSSDEWALEQEFDLLDVYYANKDVEGLTSMLYEGQQESRLLAATYLSDLGGDEEMQILREFAEGWEGEGINPFDRAADRIATRMEDQTETKAAGEVAAVAKADTSDAENREDSFRSVDANVGVVRGPYLSGTVRDAVTGEPVGGVTVKLYGPSFYKAVTDEQGFYRFSGIEESGNYVVGVESPDYLGLGRWWNAPLVALRDGVALVKDMRLERGCKAVVRVFDEAGMPVRKAKVRLSWFGGGNDDENYARGRSDDDGIAVVGAVKASQVPYMVSVWHDDYAPAERVVRLEDVNVDSQVEFVLQKGMAVKGYAHYSDGVPAEGANIIARPKGWQGGSREYESGRVDEFGAFVLENIVPGEYSFWAKFDSEGLEYAYPLEQMRLPLEGKKPVMLDIGQKSPEVMSSISGVLSFDEGLDPGFVYISVTSAQGSTKNVMLRSDVTREFEIDGLESGYYRLVFSGRYIETKVMEGVQSGGEKLNVRLEAREKAHIKGVVLAGDTGEIIPRFQVRLHRVIDGEGERRPHPGGWYHFQSRDGRFDVEADDGVYRVEVDAEGWAPTLSEPIDTEASSGVLVELQRGGDLIGRVVDTEGRPVAGAKVIPLSKAGESWREASESFFSDAGHVLTDENGVFVLEDLPVGMETIKVVHEFYADKVVGEIEVRAGDDRVGIEVVVEPWANIDGFVFTEDGRPDVNAELVFYTFDDGRAVRVGTVLADEEGYYSADGLPAEWVYVVQEDGDGAGVICRGVPAVSGVSVRVDMGSDESAKVGRLVVDGEPASGVELMVTSDGVEGLADVRWIGVTGSEGEFSVRGVPEGLYDLYCREDGGEWVNAGSVEFYSGLTELGVIEVGTVGSAVDTDEQ